jgi:glutaredoxin
MFSSREMFGRRRLLSCLALLPAMLLPLTGEKVLAQASSETTVSAACKLKGDEYTCDTAVFQKALADAKNVSIETHSVDKLAQAQLRDLLVKKLGKTIVPDASPADMVFLLIPVAAAGVQMSPGEKPLGMLQAYAGREDGARGPLLWAEIYTGQEDLPWPAVVHNLLARFQSRFHIK